MSARASVSPGRLLFAVAGGPAAWFLLLCVNYGLVRYICASGATWILHATTVAALLLVLGAAVVAWDAWRRSGRPGEATEGGVVGRTRFLAVSGVVTSAFFTLLVLGSWIPILFLHPCATP